VRVDLPEVVDESQGFLARAFLHLTIKLDKKLWTVAPNSVLLQPPILRDGLVKEASPGSNIQSAARGSMRSIRIAPCGSR
jgi:hypothetical protein